MTNPNQVNEVPPATQSDGVGGASQKSVIILGHVGYNKSSLSAAIVKYFGAVKDTLDTSPKANEATKTIINEKE